MNDNKLVANTRVERADQLNLNDIRPGVKVIVKSQRSPCNEKLMVVGIPFYQMLPGSTTYDPCVVVERIVSGLRSFRNLADMGVVPYGDGRWNQRNYTVLAPVPKWSPGLYYMPTECWNEIAPDVKMRRVGSWSNTIEVLVDENQYVGDFTLTCDWVNITQNVRVKGSADGRGITVQKLLV